MSTKPVPLPAATSARAAPAKVPAGARRSSRPTVASDVRCRAIARVLVAGWLVALILTFAADRALAYGAVAESYWEGDNGAFSHNFAANVNTETAEAARNDAMNECKSLVKQHKDRGSCRVTGEFQDKCIAYAIGAKNKKGHGWALASNKSDAERQAVAKCKDVADASNARNCKVDWSACDKVDRPAPQPAPRQPTPGEQPSPPSPPPPPVVSDNQTPTGNAYFSGQQQYEEAVQAARFATYVSYGVAVGSFLLVGATFWWATHRIKSLQSSLSGVRSGMTGVFTRARKSIPFGTVTSPRHSGSALPLVLTPVGGGAPFMLDRNRLRSSGLFIGRHDDCDVIIDDRRVSGRHARLWLDEAETLRVEDLGSSNGTWRNGQKVLRASIKPGDTLKVGDTELRL